MRGRRSQVISLCLGQSFYQQVSTTSQLAIINWHSLLSSSILFSTCHQYCDIPRLNISSADRKILHGTLYTRWCSLAVTLYLFPKWDSQTKVTPKNIGLFNWTFLLGNDSAMKGMNNMCAFRSHWLLSHTTLQWLKWCLGLFLCSRKTSYFWWKRQLTVSSGNIVCPFPAISNKQNFLTHKSFHFKVSHPKPRFCFCFFIIILKNHKQITTTFLSFLLVILE